MVPVKRSPYWKHRQVLVRGGEKLDAGVAYFVLMLEKLGAHTHFSCEGHPGGFYIVFTASYGLAKRIHDCGYFAVEIEQNQDYYWSLRIHYPQKSAKEHDETLGWASEAWQHAFGDL